MIYDKIENIELYKGLSDDIYAGLKYLKDLSPDIAPGTYEVTPRLKAIVSEYETKAVNENGYESHRKNIDIQALLTGTERIAFLPVDELQETQPYNEAIDAAFYESDFGRQSSDLFLQPSAFAIFFPQDAHMPQLCIDKPTSVKKVVIKIKI